MSLVIEFSKTLTMQYILHCLEEGLFDHIGNLKCL